MTAADALRGHKLIPGEEVLSSWPELYATERTPMSEKVIHAHFFVGACDWWLAELDHEQKIAFGYVDLGDAQCAEWGYFDLAELGGIVVRHPAGFKLVIERDLFWTPRPFSQIGGVR